MRILLCFALFGCFSPLVAQQADWVFSIDSVANLSSARAIDLTNDGIEDIVFGAGKDGAQSSNGIIAVNGANGQMLWKTPARNEVFGSARFQDITLDGIPDVFISGRQAQLLALDGNNGQVIWDYFPYSVNPADSGLYNFYNPCFIADLDQDGFQDILVSNGGDHAAPAWVTNRPPGRLMIISALSGNLINESVVPDSAETYCSPVVADIQNNGRPWVLYGTGGETLGGHFFACALDSLVNGSLQSSVVLASDPALGFIAPASVAKDASGFWKIFVQSYGGKISCIDGASLSTVWSAQIPGTESSSAITLGNFTGSLAPDAFAVVYKGVAPSYTDFYQVLVDGETGNIQHIDSIGTLHFASANAVDLNNDGRDEAVISSSSVSNGAFSNAVHVFDFQQDTVIQLTSSASGVNIASTPLIKDIDADGSLELFTLTKNDSINPSAANGVSLRRFSLSSGVPNSGIAWGSYMGSSADGHYSYAPLYCGGSTVSTGASVINPSCNGLANGGIVPFTNSASGPHTFLWNNGSNDTALYSVPAGTYSVRIVSAQGCYEDLSYSLQDPYIISFGGIIPPTCPGDTNGQAVLNSSGCQCMFSTCTFLWENGVTTKPNYQLPEGWSSVEINHPGGCIVVDSVFVPFSSPVIDSSITVTATCFNGSDGSISLIPSAGFSPVSFLWSNGTTDSFIDSLSAGFYTVLVQDVRGCADSLAFAVSENSQIFASAGINPIVCNGNASGGFNLNATGGIAPYATWVNGTLVSNPSTGFSAGNYALFLTDANGCFSDTLSLNLSDPPTLAVNFSIVPEQIPNSFSGIVTAHVYGGAAPYTFLWSDPNAQTDSVAVYLNTGWYQVTITDSLGCSIQDSVFVGVTGLRELAANKFLAYPNPAKDRLILSRKASLAHVFNSLGQSVAGYSNCSEISLAGLPDGSYILMIMDGNTIERFSFQKIN